MDAQIDMLEEMGDTVETGYISPEAVIVFAYKDGDLTYKMAETINISDALFNKIKNLFKKMYACYMAYFFRDRTEYCCNDTDAAAADPVAGAPYAVDAAPDEFAEFFDSVDAPAE